MFSISERWVPGGRGAASTFTIRIRDETAKMSQNECRSNRCFSGKGAINITYGGRGGPSFHRAGEWTFYAGPILAFAGTAIQEASEYATTMALIVSGPIRKWGA